MGMTFTETDTFTTGADWVFERVTTKDVHFVGGSLRPVVSTKAVDYFLYSTLSEGHLAKVAENRLFPGELTTGLIGSIVPLVIDGDKPERLLSAGPIAWYRCRFRVLSPVRIGAFCPTWLSDPMVPAIGQSVDLANVPR